MAHRNVFTKAMVVFLLVFFISLPSSSLPDVNTIYVSVRAAALASTIYLANKLDIIRIKKNGGINIIINDTFIIKLKKKESSNGGDEDG